MAKATPKRIKKGAVYSLTSFYLDDQPSTLFPLSTNRVLVESASERLLEFGRELAFGDGSFLPQRRVYANKDPHHLRRTVKLDPVADIFLYDLVFRNRARFRKPHSQVRRHFGYRFMDGKPVPATKSYQDFQSEVWEANIFSEEFTYFDVSAYFNGVYHHDLHAWFASLQPVDADDIAAFGKFFRQINAGRSLDCLPQGLYPAKMIGNDFLRFIEESASVRSEKILRFMDDVYLFDDSKDVLQADFAEIQRLLGLKGLSVNASKTRTDGMPLADEASDGISEIKKRLLRRRRDLIVSHYGSGSGKVDSNADSTALSDQEIDFILSTLDSGKLGEDDAELIMIVMRDHVDRLERHLRRFAEGYPHLAKNFHGLCAAAKDKENVASVVLDVARRGDHIGEYQLFWFGVMLDEYLMDTKLAPDLITTLFKHRSATDISRAKILEIRDGRYGLPEMRESYLREGRSDWLAWSSAVGALSLDEQARNYLLNYFANGSVMNALIAEIVQD